ncbi:Helicase conserved C-terminal domain-containing protein [Arthrobacter sp. 9AX]|uniref:helicase-associated domain-containing protein n=1 Tax=Arthrobacter sp. 9AX TaxID=2653131 RepID=UPI0012F0F273|nr:helicase-associated domain-containing protein [Arthrobacter sp. 9AX]VXC43910.1 Helicase conserved C-terminal domain-containing protein [Arthrobacter sp. 9AX]
MSLIRALSKDLEARSDDSLRALFDARPDLISPTVPDFAALAARASGRVSVQRALERLNRPQMQVLETLHLSTNTDTEHSASAAGLRKLISGSTLAAVERILASLQELALVHRADPPHGTPPGKQRYYLPVGSLKDVVGIYPAGLGRSYTELVRLQPAFAQRAVQLVGELHRSGAAIHGATTPMEAALALQHWTSSPEALQHILSTAPERTTALLAKFRNWAMGAVPQAQRKASITSEGPDVGPVDWLLARGLLVPLDAAHVELPHSVGVSLRGGAIINDFALSPPVPELGTTTAALRRNAALGAIAETLRLVGEMLHAVKEQPLATLRSGGVGVREMRRLSEVLRIDQPRVGLLLELCGLAGLIRLDVDSSSWVQPAELEWLVLPRQEQWLWLVNAWLASERVPSMVGQPINGTLGAAAGHRAASGSTVIALSAEAQRPDAPVVRKRILEILNELTREAAAPDGTAPVLNAAAVLQRAEWAQPRMARRFSSLIRGVLGEAELLGLLGSGALSQLGSAIANDDPDAALAILGEHLPAELNHVLLQADLTAVAPGYLAPGLTEKLLAMADAEGQGPATIYRFSPGSIRRALDAGHGAPDLLEFLREHSATAVPQPLQYLVEDTAARHGRLRVGGAASFIHSEDEAALLELLQGPKTEGLGLVRIAPTVLISTSPPRETANVLRSLGLSPSLDESEQPVLRLRRVPAPNTPSRPVYTAPRTAPGAKEVQAQLDVLRHRPAAVVSHAGEADVGSEAATQLGLEALQRAIRLKQRISMNVVDGMGNANLEIVVPLSVSGGRVRVFDPAKDTERVLSIHRIIDIEAAEELRQ